MRTNKISMQEPQSTLKKAQNLATVYKFKLLLGKTIIVIKM